MEKLFSKRTKIILGIMILGLVSVIFYQSYAIFKESRKLRFIWGVVEDFEQTPDIIIEIFVNEEKSVDGKFPNKQNHKFDRLVCTNSGNAEFDEDKWQMAIKNITEPTECGIYFVVGKDYAYTGDYQEFVVPKSGTYKIELWGAEGFGKEIRDVYIRGGYGAYVSGEIILAKGEKLYIYVGPKGGTFSFNNSTVPKYAAYAGGATDIRLVSGEWNSFNSLKSRIMVAGAGGNLGGSNTIYTYKGGNAGGLIGYNGEGGTMQSAGGVGATQTTGSAFGYSVHEATWGGFGGNGYYSGIRGSGGNDQGAGGGGTSFISGHNGTDAIAELSTEDNIIHTGQANHYSGKTFINTLMIDGAGYKWTNIISNQTPMPDPNGGTYSLGIGHSGDGYARISCIGDN